MCKGAGGSARQCLTLLEVAEMFGEEEKARGWIEKLRWPEGPCCPHCGSFNVQCNIKHPSQSHRCRECPHKPMFTMRVGTVMEGTHLNYREWAIGIYLYTTNIKGISSIQLHRELGIWQKAAWFLLHRLRRASEKGEGLFSGPVEADETYIGGKRKNMSNEQRKKLSGSGRGTVGKTSVVGVKDRATNKVAAKPVCSTGAEELQGMVREQVKPGAILYTDEAKAYQGMAEFHHEVVNHSAREYVRGQAHRNGLESFWSMLKRGYYGIYHKMSVKHLGRYVGEFVHRHNIRGQDTMEQMSNLVQWMIGKRLRYRDLIAVKGLAINAMA